MTTVTTMPLSGDWTVDDLDRLPDDGLRYELVDGVLLVSPSPAAGHQLALSALLVQLSNAAPPELRVLAAPLDITFSATRRLQPDIVVLHKDQLAAPKVAGLPVLAIEVLSRSTRATDMTLKRHVLEQAGVPSYWLLDCEVPYLTVLELVDGAYQDVAHVQGSEAYEGQRPFPVRIVPLDLLR
ncbi:MAG: Uma2 family endonuclease [Actinobacteria bacterium]|nr:Uma2 family endonuclease [Actinomycetota bacterium]